MVKTLINLLEDRRGGALLLRPWGPAFVGESLAIREAIARAKTVAPLECPVLIVGEEGTGKELLARAIHAESKRSAGPFVHAACGRVPRASAHPELRWRSVGRLGELPRAVSHLVRGASGGTLFFDEIAATSLSDQVKAHEVLKSGQIRMPGELSPCAVDVRIVAATSSDLRIPLREKRFLLDLYRHLNPVRIHLPPLRERSADIPLMANAILTRLNERYAKSIGFSKGAAEAMRSYPFDGNVAELEDKLERAVLFSDKEELGVEDVLDEGPPSDRSGERAAVRKDDLTLPRANGGGNRR